MSSLVINHRNPVTWRGLRAVLIVTCATLLAACATPPPSPEATGPAHVPVSQEPGHPRWWYMRFRIARDADDEVNSYLDALIADRILSAVIARHAADIELWRFHRRWPDDETGHQFSFIFFAPVPVAEDIITEIERTPLLDRLSSEGLLVEHRTDAAGPKTATDPASTSDPSWAPEIQREWPKFIMGASRMWLGLVQSEAAKQGDLTLHERYRRVEDSLDTLWFEQGNHAFFHHLSALFGYKPLRVIRRDIMTF